MGCAEGRGGREWGEMGDVGRGGTQGAARVCDRSGREAAHSAALASEVLPVGRRASLFSQISFKNLKRVAKELGENMTDEELQEMIDEADRDGDGEINEEEFLRIMKKTSLY